MILLVWVDRFAIALRDIAVCVLVITELCIESILKNTW